MLKCKIFSDRDTEKLENKINKFLESHDNINEIKQNINEHLVIITIFYYGEE